MINYSNDTSVNGGVPASAFKLTARIAKAPSVSYGAVQFGTFGASSPLQGCSVYYSQIQVNV